MNLGFGFSIVEKKAIGIMIGITLNLYITLGIIDILTTLSFTIYKHRIYFHLFRPLISFASITLSFRRVNLLQSILFF